MTFQSTLQNMFISKVAPRSSDSDVARREFIFNTISLALFMLSIIAFLITLTSDITEDYYRNQSPLMLFVMSTVMLVLYWFSRRRFHNWIVICFLTVYLFSGTYALYTYGYVLPDGLLTYVLVIIMAGVLLSTRAALVVSAIIAFCLGTLAYAQIHHFTKPDISEQLKVLDGANIIISFIFFMVIILVCWLSNREINQSLQRAQQSEKALLAERNLLEVKVEQRTKALEQVHIEKLQDMYRFAEFGRLTSSLLHDLANPLTSASLELDHITGKPTQRSLREVRKCVRAIEMYVEAARRQLRNESEITLFDVAKEIRQVQAFLKSRIRSSGIHFKSQLSEGVQLRGDAVRFNQIMANLFANAIDAYEATEAAGKYIAVTLRLTAKFVIITVEDQGTGIAVKKLPRIFEPFYTSKRTERGTGIGLAITKQTVETDFHGTIGVTSVVGDGTCFTITLPLP